ncbi:MAG: anti-anti-sigma factor [Candidatus Krumholzibacteriia bacterium]|jgi:anti-anti-sigma factor
MPREMTRPFVRTNTPPTHVDPLQIQVSQVDRTVRVTLSGILDSQGVEKMKRQVTAQLVSRGCRVVLDGSRLTHFDYRATGALIKWHRQLRDFNHQMYLLSWSDYLKAILVMEDWDRELGAAGSEPSNWRELGGLPAVSQT